MRPTTWPRTLCALALAALAALGCDDAPTDSTTTVQADLGSDDARLDTTRDTRLPDAIIAVDATTSTATDTDATTPPEDAPDATTPPDAPTADTADVAAPPDDPFPPPERILFIGNSFTFGGPVPVIVDDLANDAGWPDPTVEYVAFGGESLAGHRDDRPETLAAVDAGDWDVVVLQEFSTGPTDSALGRPDRFKEAATWFHDRIKATSPDARVILYETWARHPDHDYYPGTFDDPADMQAQLRYHYGDAADTYIPANASVAVVPPVVVAPAGDAWERHLAQPDAVRLHASDDWHAGSNGQYLNGLVIYGTIYNRAVTGLGPRNLSADVAALLQRDADATTGLTTPGGPDGMGREPGLAPGQVVRVDVGEASSSGPDWTALSGPLAGTVSNLVDIAGTPTDVDVAVTVGFAGTNGVGVSANTLSWPADVTGDSFFCGSFDTHAAGLLAPGQVTLRGLAPGAAYDLRLYGSRTGTDGGRGRLTRFTVIGASTQQLDLEASDNAGETADFLAVADANGELVIDAAVSPDGAARFCYLGALELTGR